MKKYIILAISLSIFGCNGELEVEKAKEIIKPTEIEISILDGPNLIAESGKKMIKPDPVKIVSEKVKIVSEKVEVVPVKTVKVEPVNPVEITPVYKECPKPKPVKKKYRIFNKEKREKQGYKLLYHYRNGNCRGMVYQMSIQYYYYNLFVDCRNNYVFQKVRK